MDIGPPSETKADRGQKSNAAHDNKEKGFAIILAEDQTSKEGAQDLAALVDGPEEAEVESFGLFGGTF